jgi:hypothetical protein
MKSSHILFTLLILGGFTFVQCKSKKNATTKNDDSKKISEIIVHETYNYPKDTPAFEITSAEIKADVLTLVVSYSGGCQQHTFTLNGTKNYMKSMPPKLGLFLEHNSNGDSCRELKTETLQFDLKKVRYPGTEKDYTVILTIDKFDGQLEYKY